jgi:anthranilate/para-aminobenzoate synthase component II
MPTEAAPLAVLLIDNYDSYTFNLFQQIAVVNGGAWHAESAA